MFQCGKTFSQARLIGWINTRHDHARTARQAIQHHPPRVNDHGVAMRLASGQMIAALRGRDDVSQILYGTCTHQGFEMRLAGGGGKCRRHQDDVHVGHGAIHLGKAQVIADGQPDTAKRRIQHHNPVTGFDGFFFLIVFDAEVESEQVNLVVARHQLALVVVNQTAVADFFGVVASQRHGTAYQPDLVFFRGSSEKFLDRALALLLACGNLISVLVTHNGEKLGQRHQFCAAACGQCDEPFGFRQIGADIGAGSHLDGGHTDDAGRSGACRFGHGSAAFAFGKTGCGFAISFGHYSLHAAALAAVHSIWLKAILRSWPHGQPA